MPRTTENHKHKLDHILIGCRVKWLREAMGIPQVAVAKAIGTVPPNYSGIERGKRRVTVEQYYGFLIEYGIKPDFFLTGNIYSLPEALLLKAKSQKESSELFKL